MRGERLRWICGRLYGSYDMGVCGPHTFSSFLFSLSSLLTPTYILVHVTGGIYAVWFVCVSGEPQSGK